MNFKPHATTMCLKHLKKKIKLSKCSEHTGYFWPFQNPEGEEGKLEGFNGSIFKYIYNPSHPLNKHTSGAGGDLHQPPFTSSLLPSGSQEGDDPTLNINTKETQAGVMSV